MLVMCLVFGLSLMAISIIMGAPLYAKYLPFKMYYVSALLLFTCKVYCLQIFEHMSAHWVMKI